MLTTRIKRVLEEAQEWLNNSHRGSKEKKLRKAGIIIMDLVEYIKEERKC